VPANPPSYRCRIHTACTRDSSSYRARRASSARTASKVRDSPGVTLRTLGPARTWLRRGCRQSGVAQVGEDGEHPAVAVLDLGETELDQQVAHVSLDGAFADD